MTFLCSSSTPSSTNSGLSAVIPTSAAPSARARALTSSAIAASSATSTRSGATGPSRSGTRSFQCFIAASRSGNGRCHSGTSSIPRSRKAAQSSASCMPCSRIQLVPFTAVFPVSETRREV